MLATVPTQAEERLARLAEAARRSSEAAADDRAALYAAMSQAENEGMTIGRIARATGMARSYVHKRVVEAASEE